MRKPFITLLLLFISFLSVNAQETAFSLKKDETSGDYYYEEVVSLGDMKQADIYARAKTWIIANFKTADNNIAFNEKEFTADNSAAVKIDEKKTMGWAIYEGFFDFKFHVWVKEGKYKFRIDNISYNMFYASYPDGKKTKSGVYSDISDNKIGKYLKEQADTKLMQVATTFKKGMSTDQKQVKNDW
jgi:hypothetical protein